MMRHRAIVWKREANIDIIHDIIEAPTKAEARGMIAHYDPTMRRTLEHVCEQCGWTIYFCVCNGGPK